MTLDEFLLARIADDEAEAIRLCPGRNAHNGQWRSDSALLATVRAMDSRAAIFIARHDPARVLAECEAKRAIVEARPLPVGHTWDMIRAWRDSTLKRLAAVYADHPDYRAEWAL